MLELAKLIHRELVEEFSTIYLSGNLRDTIKVSYDGKSATVEIPAEMYDLKLFKEEGAIVYTGKGSYAEAVNKKGGFSGSHKNYVERAIELAIFTWMKSNGIKGRITND